MSACTAAFSAMNCPAAVCLACVSVAGLLSSNISGLGGGFVYWSFQAYHWGTDSSGKEDGGNSAFARRDIEVMHGSNSDFHGAHFASTAGVSA